MKTLINQTHSNIQLEISNALEIYPYYPYQQIFANPDRRQDLMSYILKHMSSIYNSADKSIDLEVTHFCSDDYDPTTGETAFPTSIGLMVEALVHRGIRHLIDKNTIFHGVPPATDAGRMASSWFG